MLFALKNYKNRFRDYLRYTKNYKGLYSPTTSNYSLLDHIMSAAEWLCHAQDHGSDRGVSWGVKLGEGFLDSYPETTGYIIPTFIKLSTAFTKDDYSRRAIEMGLWEAEVQMESGAVMGGRYNLNPTPAVFNTGQVLQGWSYLLELSHDEVFERAGTKAADWLCEVQNNNGDRDRFNSEFCNNEGLVYNVLAAWGLARFGHIVGRPKYIDAAVKNADYALSFVTVNGWVKNCCLDCPDEPLLHTQAYTLEGFWKLGCLLNRNDYLDAAMKIARGMLGNMRPNGFIPGRSNSSQKPAVTWCCLTGSAQSAYIFWGIYKKFDLQEFKNAAIQINRYLMSKHDITSDDESIRGGVLGSWPPYGSYGQFCLLNWATKYFIDALLAEYEESSESDR